MSEKTFNEEIIKIVDDALKSGEVHQIIHDEMTRCFQSAFHDAIAYGHVRNAIKDKMNEVLVPFIEGYDMTEYVVKLDSVLTDLVNEVNISDNRTILKNFKAIVGAPVPKVVTLQDIFNAYCTFVAANVDTEDLEVYTDDDVHYELVDVSTDILPDETVRYGSPFAYAFLVLQAKDVVNAEDLSYTVRLTRWKRGIEDSEWEISFDMDPRLKSLRYMNEFETYLVALSSAGTKLEFTEEHLEDEIEPDRKPEVTYY